MWVPGSLAFLVAAVWLAMGLLSGSRTVRVMAPAP